MHAVEATSSFACFGSTCAVFVIGGGRCGTPDEAVARAERQLLSWHERFTRFEPTSELSRLNTDPRETVPVSGAMARFAEAVVDAARLSGGLVDATMLAELEDAGYWTDLGAPLDLPAALAIAPARAPAQPNRDLRWASIAVDPVARAITRPPGVMLDSGGLAKGCSRTSSPRAWTHTTATRSTARATCASAARPACPARSSSRARSTAARCTRSSSPTPASPPAASASEAGSTSPAPPPTICSTRPPGARLHRHRPGHGARAQRPGGRGAQQGRDPERPGLSRALAPRRRRRGLRRRLTRRRRAA